MGTIPAREAARVANRVLSLVAGVVLAVLIVQHSATRRPQES
jgi:hypothetical protein